MLTAANSLLYATRIKDMTSESDVEVHLDPTYNRQKLPDNGEVAIEETWKEKLSANSTLFNGTKFRLNSIEEKDSKLILNVGITDYKDFQGTNLSKDALDLQSKGLCDHDNSQAYMSDALGVGALVLTRDDFVVLLFRSKRCGEDTELWDRPGGHPEPKVGLDPFPNKPWFLCVCSTSLLKTLWEKKKLLVMSNFSFSHNVFYPFGELCTIFIKLVIVVCKLFQFGRV